MSASEGTQQELSLEDIVKMCLLCTLFVTTGRGSWQGEETFEVVLERVVCLLWSFVAVLMYLERANTLIEITPLIIGCVGSTQLKGL